MSSTLYNRDILRLATSIQRQGRLAAPDATSDRRSLTCGSRVIVDICVDSESRVSDLAIDVRACALGQASAALMSGHAVGRTANELEAAVGALRCFLSSEHTVAPDFWPDIAILNPARGYPARHPSILLAFEATSEAATRAVAMRDGAADLLLPNVRGKQHYE